jgi:UDP-N-acetylglucosamine 4,6-dehydratase
MGSRGSVIPFFESIKSKGVLPITDERMTRFMITLDQAVELVWHALDDMVGGEIYVKKIPSMSVIDLANALAPECQLDIVGIRPGEKVHEQMIGEEDAEYTFEYPEHYKILPVINSWSTSPERIKDGVRVTRDFVYRSDKNTEWMSADELMKWVATNRDYIGKI